MKGRDFSLKPFPSDGLVPGFQITGSIERAANIIAVSYTLLGPLAELGLAAPAEKPSRKNSLWEETCFELFIGVKNSSRYREFNISPAGHWNVYHFNDYRQGMQEETAIASLPINIEHQSEALRLSLKIGLDDFVLPEEEIEAAVSAVIKTVNGKMTYWALVHPGPEADFHRRDSFIVDL